MTDSIANGLAVSREERMKPSADAMLAELDAMAAEEAAPAQVAPRVTPQATPKVQPKAPLQTTPGILDEAGNAVVGGLRDGAVNTLQAMQDMGDWVNNNLIDLRIAKKIGCTRIRVQG